MNSFIFGAQTLTHFTKAIEAGFRELGIKANPGFELYQIHASPKSIGEDLELLKRSKLSKSKKNYLIHRPDELLLVPELKTFFADHTDVQIVLLGDLVLHLEFWKTRQNFIHIVPHPFLDTEMPVQRNSKYVIGSFTTWGEMRKLEHFVELAQRLPQDQFEFLIGGTLNGIPLREKDVPSFIKLETSMFHPHFNVQLYHLNGKKRMGESSGSLHRGISIPVIFEANGIERVEGLKVVKIESNEELTEINYAQAAEEIGRVSQDLESHLEHNKKRAGMNRPSDFASRILDIEVK